MIVSVPAVHQQAVSRHRLSCRCHWDAYLCALRTYSPTGSFSGTPEDAYYLSNLQKKVDIPKGVTACASGYTGVIMRQPVAVITTGGAWQLTCTCHPPHSTCYTTANCTAVLHSGKNTARHTARNQLLGIMGLEPTTTVCAYCPVPKCCLLQASAPLLLRCVCLMWCHAVGITSVTSSTAAHLAGQHSWGVSSTTARALRDLQTQTQQTLSGEQELPR